MRLTNAKLAARADSARQSVALSRRIRSPRCTHHERAYRFGAKILRQEFARNGAVPEHQQAVAQLEQLVEVFRDDEHAGTVIARLTQQRAQRHCTARVKTARR